MKFLFRALLEIVGKPKAHVEESMKKYVENLKQDKRFTVKKEHYDDIKEHEDLWATFAELEIATDDIHNILHFGLDYMPSSIEILEPANHSFNANELSMLFTDLQGKLHQVDMVAKQIKIELDAYKKNSTHLLTNYLTVLLTKQKKTSAELSRLTGIEQDKLEDFLDQLIDKGKIDLKEGEYFLK